MSVRPRLAVLAVLAAGGVAFGGYYLWPSGRHVAPCVPQHARVPAAAQKALAAYTARIRHDVQRSSAGTRTEETWYDSLTGAQRQVWFDSRGRIENEVGTIRQGDKVSTVWVSYAGRTWLSNRDQSARIADSNAAATIAES